MDEFPPVLIWSGAHTLRIPLAAEFSTPFFDYYNCLRSFFQRLFLRGVHFFRGNRGKMRPGQICWSSFGAGTGR
jgi:hypothetical protein